jgi:DNA/RNA-binding domain of Phe-tRNA-synthetase-like protein
VSNVISVTPHPLLEVACFLAEWDHPLGRLPSPESLVRSLDAAADHERDDAGKSAVRTMLRQHGYRPAGRGKPASEFLVAASEKGILSSINLAVDACNAASLWGGLPISVVDTALASPPWRIEVAAEGSSYVFNRSGQEISLTGLLCLEDSEGPCANAIKDSQRTKTHEGTRAVLAVVWGTTSLPGHAARVAARFEELLGPSGASIHPVAARIEENSPGD